MTQQQAERRALLLAYYFPPIGGGGIQRPLTLVQQLAEVDPGWRVSVLTGPGTGVDRWSPKDTQLLEQLPAGTMVDRVPGPEPAGSRWGSIAERWLRVPSTRFAWWSREARKKGLDIAGETDVLIAIMPPYASAGPAAKLARSLGKPWIADLGDPWALDEMTLYPTGLHRWLELRSMRRLLRTAAAIVTTTPEAARRIGDAFPELSDRPIVSIPNGFSAEAFATTPPARSDGQFRIVHTGSLHTDLGRRQREITPVRRLLGGGATATDLLARSHVYLLEAVERLVARDASLADVIEVHFAGVLSPADELEARRLSQSRLHGHLGHAESVELMQTADLLFLPMQKMPHGMRATIVPGKTYEYLAAGPAILAAVPEGDARDILVDAGTARICEPDDVDGMADAIAAEVASWRAGRSGPRVAAPILAPFERRAVAASYAELLASVVPPRTAASRQPRTAPSGEDREAVPSDSLRCDSRR